MKFFTEHPNSVGETYWQHFRFALCCGVYMVLAGFACIIHAIVPELFKYTASTELEKLNCVIKTRKTKPVS